MFTETVWRALLMSSLAGLATLLGAAVVLLLKGASPRLISASLGLAGGVMICVSFHDLWPHSEVYFSAVAGHEGGLALAVLFLVGGVLLIALLDRLVPHEGGSKQLGGEHNDLYHLGMVSLLAIALHNLPEGMATFMANYSGEAIGLTVALAIGLHNIPEGVTVALPIYLATGSRGRALGLTLLAGLAEPFGALIAFLLLRVFLNDFTMGVIFAMAAGIMLYIAIEELLPSSRQYGHKRAALVATFVGITVMPLVHLVG